MPVEAETCCPIPGAGRDDLLPFSSEIAGGCVAVVRRHPFRGVTMLVIEQPDGTMALVSEWMTRPAAAAVEFGRRHAFRLQNCGPCARSSLPSYRCRQIAATEIGTGYHTLSAQRELFPRAAAKASLPPAVIKRLVLLVDRRKEISIGFHKSTRAIDEIPAALETADRMSRSGAAPIPSFILGPKPAHHP